MTIWLTRQFYRWVPECRWKRARCGGYWVHYVTSLPMPSTWTQGNRKPDRLPCQVGPFLATEDHGPIRVRLW